jgi:Rad3-related DNA helicase
MNETLRLPEWFTGYRSHQEQAVNEIVEAFRSGQRIVMLDAPTGSGKTLIAEAVRQILDSSGLYICTTKSLQDQFVASFPTAQIRGRANYPCSGHEDQFPLINASLCTKRSAQDDCRFCDTTCPYLEAKHEATSANLTCTNTAYALGVWNSPRPFLDDRGLCVIDEADVIESEIMNHEEIRIPNYLLEQAKLDRPPFVTREAGLKDGRWQTWLGDAHDAISELYRSTPPTTPKQIARRNALSRLRARLRTTLDDNWVLTDDLGVVFKPYRVDHLAPSVALSHAHRYLFMSGTLLSGELMAEELGIESFSYVAMPSQFPAARRPIVYRGVADMSRTTIDGDFPLLVAELTAILAAHPNTRILVHTHSYAITRRLAAALPPARLVSYASARDREPALRTYLSRPDAVMLASSFERGIDLPHDLCRVQVVAKVPYPYLGDRLVSARLHSAGGRGWYDMHTVRSLVQSFGRAMRSADDWAITYILDKGFAKFYRNTRYLFPAYIREAIDFSGGIESQEAIAALRKEEQHEQGASV